MIRSQAYHSREARIISITKLEWVMGYVMRIHVSRRGDWSTGPVRRRHLRTMLEGIATSKRPVLKLHGMWYISNELSPLSRSQNYINSSYIYIAGKRSLPYKVDTMSWFLWSGPFSRQYFNSPTMFTLACTHSICTLIRNLLLYSPWEIWEASRIVQRSR